MSHKTNVFHSNARYLLSLGLFNFLIGFYRIGYQSIWLDEYLTLAVTKNFQSLTMFFRTFPEQHPLYYFIVYFLNFNKDLNCLRFFSLIIGTACIYPLYSIGKRLFSERVGLLSCFLFAISPFILYYNQEGRMYTLLMLLSLIQINSLLSLLRRNGQKQTYAFIALSILAMYTHFFFAFILFSEAIFLLYLWKKQEHNVNIKQFIIIYGIIGCAYLPWLIFLIKNLGGNTQSWKGISHIILGIPYTFFRFAVGYAIFPLNYEVKLDFARFMPAALKWSVVVFLAYVPFILLFWKSLKKMTPVQKLIPALSFLPICFVVIASCFKNMVSERYVIYSAPIFYIAIASVLNQNASVKKYTKVLSIAFPAVLSIIGLFFYYTNHDFGKTNYKAASQYIQTYTSEDAIIICHPDTIRGPEDYYLKNTRLIFTWNSWRKAPKGREVWILERLANYRFPINLKEFGYLKMAEETWRNENGLRLTKWQVFNE